MHLIYYPSNLKPSDARTLNFLAFDAMMSRMNFPFTLCCNAQSDDAVLVHSYSKATRDSPSK